MSTKSTLFYLENHAINVPVGGLTPDHFKHALKIHAYTEMHESSQIIKFDLECMTCNCNYSFIMTEHLGKQLIGILQDGS